MSTASGYTTDYISGIQYKNGVLDFIDTEEGRYEFSGSPVYQYYLKDHLGNVRVIIQKNTATTATAIQETEYYAFGLNAIKYDNNTKNKYLYNGKELQDEDNLNLYDYGARLYDPVVARWNAVDPLAETSRRWSPYNYVENNPVRLIDPDGMSSGDPNSSDSQYDEQATYIDNYIATQNAKDDAASAYKERRAQFAWFNWQIEYGGGTGEQTAGTGDNGTASSTAGPPLASNDPGAALIGSNNADQQRASLVFSRLVWSGTPIVGSDKLEGVLFWEDTFNDGSIRYTGRWDAVSGSKSLFPTPYAYDQSYLVSNHRNRTEKGYVRDGIGFTFDITPDPFMGRTSLRIHPDGGPPGTAGCIGLTGNADALTEFEDRMMNYLDNHASISLWVSN